MNDTGVGRNRATTVSLEPEECRLFLKEKHGHCVVVLVKRTEIEGPRLIKEFKRGSTVCILVVIGINVGNTDTLPTRIDLIYELNDYIRKILYVGLMDTFGYLQQLLKNNPGFLVNTSIVMLAIIFASKIIVYCCGNKRKNLPYDDQKLQVPVATPIRDPILSWSVFDLAKTAYEPGHAEAAINIIEKLHYNVNSDIPSNGLTLFLCACLSGHKKLINYMLEKGADIKRTTKAGDTALYLATFGILSSVCPDISILEDLIHAGCDVNAANMNGYTALHRAAGHGNLQVIQTLLKNGADPYKASVSGIYPIDSATNAGNLEAANLLKIHVPNPHVWELVDPHTPPHIKLGLQSPQRKHLIESTRRIMSPRIM